jgi:hypothetical protein
MSLMPHHMMAVSVGGIAEMPILCPASIATPLAQSRARQPLCQGLGPPFSQGVGALLDDPLGGGSVELQLR